ncbi:MAG: hypothetical protein C4K60_09525 [Ideonella sp. MAG2]|nr:MAG: hypothetical protein C4K60_09525 [Ideonella sp. MAG2]
MRPPSTPTVLALALLFFADPRAAGAALLDPTRPLVGASRDDIPAPKPADAAPAPAAEAAAPVAPPSLQSLQVPQQGEATAIVDGQLLKVGSKLGGYEVTHIDAHGLTVRGPTGRERWTLAGVEVLDSRQPAASLKPGPQGDVRLPARRANVVAAPTPQWDPTPRTPRAAAPSPLVFPLPAPQGQTLPVPTPAPVPVPVPRPAAPVTPAEPAETPSAPPVPLPTARPVLKQASSSSFSAPVVAQAPTVACQLPEQAAPLPVAAPKPSKGGDKAWTAAAAPKPLRLDLDDMRRFVQLMPPASAGPATKPATPPWQQPLGPKPTGHLASAWAATSAASSLDALPPTSAGPALVTWRPPQAEPKTSLTAAVLAKKAPARYAPVKGPRPMPASVVWRAAPRTAWQPQGVNELPGTRSSEWAIAPTPLLRIAALEPQAVPQRLFAKAISNPAPKGAAPRWAMARKAPTVQMAAAIGHVRPVVRELPRVQMQAAITHAHPMALPQWRVAPTEPGDTSSQNQIAYALETP